MYVAFVIELASVIFERLDITSRTYALFNIWTVYPYVMSTTHTCGRTTGSTLWSFYLSSRYCAWIERLFICAVVCNNYTGRHTERVLSDMLPHVAGTRYKVIYENTKLGLVFKNK